MTKRKLSTKLLALTFANAIVMLFIAYYWLSLPHTFGDEAFFIKWSSLVKKSLFAFDKKPDPDKVLFIDVSGSKTTIPDPEPDIPSVFPDSNYHRKVITDRANLIKLFSIMNKSKDSIQLIVCDILFEDSTGLDRQLEQNMQQFGTKMLTVGHIESKQKLIKPVIKAPYALASYRASRDEFLKFPLLIQDSMKTIPLRMYELIDKKSFKKSGALTTMELTRKTCLTNMLLLKKQILR